MGVNLGTPLDKQATPKRLILAHHLAPGDVLVMSAAVESLHLQYPGEYLTDVDVSVPAIYEHNPRITKLTRDEAFYVRMQYPLIHNCSRAPAHFMNGFVDHLAEQIDSPLSLQVNRPSVYLSAEEKTWLPQVHEVAGKATPYWVVNAGVKSDYTAKQWGGYQEVVNRLRGRVQFVQIGEAGHNHPKLDNVIDLRGKTDTRQFLRLCYHAAGGVGPTTFLQHVLAAFEKPYVCVVGGREPKAWLDYPTQVTLSTQGQLPCCRAGGCWKSRVVKLGDDGPNDRSLCELPTWDGGHWVGKCMALITPCDVVAAIERYYYGGVIC